MLCPPKIAEIVGEILRTGLLRIRNSEDIGRARLEADHLHNLPGLLIDYKPELLDYYWNIERVCFAKRSSPEGTGFESLWQALAEHVDSGKIEVAAGRRN